MGRTSHDRHIHFYYNKNFIDWYKSLDEATIEYFDSIGRPNGYSSMNVAMIMGCICAIQERFDIPDEELRYHITV